MARGYPDWFGVSVYPIRGTTYRASGTKVCSQIGATTIDTILGRGMTFGGIVSTGDADASEWDAVELWIDGLLISGFNHWGLYMVGFSPPAQYPLTITRFDTTTPYYALNILGNLIFEQNLTLKYSAEDANARDVSYELTYTLVG